MDKLERVFVVVLFLYWPRKYWIFLFFFSHELAPG